MKYRMSKRMEIAGAHKLQLSYNSPCNNLHGHNWIVTVYMQADKLNEDGMIMDFKHVKNQIMKKFDHKYFNDVVPNLNPTAENLSRYFMSLLPYDESKNSFCYRVDVQETEGNIASFEVENIKEFLEVVEEMERYDAV